MVCGGRDPLVPASGWPGAGAGTAATAAVAAPAPGTCVVAPGGQDGTFGRLGAVSWAGIELDFGSG
jgi:hypothetical protein